MRLAEPWCCHQAPPPPPPRHAGPHWNPHPQHWENACCRATACSIHVAAGSANVFSPHAYALLVVLISSSVGLSGICVPQALGKQVRSGCVETVHIGAEVLRRHLPPHEPPPPLPASFLSKSLPPAPCPSHHLLSAV